MRFCFVGPELDRDDSLGRFFVDFVGGLGDLARYTCAADDPEAANDRLVTELAAADTDCFIFWQTEHIAERLLPMGVGRFVMVPSAAAVARRPATFWRQFVDAQFLSFSRTDHESAQRSGCRSAYFRYFPEPADLPALDFTGPLSACIASGRAQLAPALDEAVQVCAQLGIGSLHVHSTRSEGEPDQLRPFTMNGIAVTRSAGEGEGDARAALKASHFYLATADSDIFQLAEAMAAGQIVVGPDQPPVNEYISHLTTGLLYRADPSDLGHRPAAHDLAGLSAAARLSAARGFAEWRQDWDRLSSLVLGDGKRWSTKDFSSHFRNRIRQQASARMRAA